MLHCKDKPHRSVCGFSLLLIALWGGQIGIRAHALPPLQLFIDITPEGGVLSPPPGDYAGPVIIDKAMTLDGKGKV